MKPTKIKELTLSSKGLDDHKFTLAITSKETKPGCWSYLNVSITEGDRVVGEYTRQYSSFYNTFQPFYRDGNPYALFSADYTAASVMDLTTGKVIAEMASHRWGLCPKSFYIPTCFDDNETKIDNVNGRFAFVYGCIWACPDEVKFIDLTRMFDGEISMDSRFGSLDLHDDQTMESLIKVECFENLYDDFCLWYGGRRHNTFEPTASNSAKKLRELIVAKAPLSDIDVWIKILDSMGIDVVHNSRGMFRNGAKIK